MEKKQSNEAKPPNRNETTFVGKLHRSTDQPGGVEVKSINLELYRYYTRDEIFAEFKKPQPTEAEGWFLSSKRLVGLFAIGERPPEIHFCDNSRFHWYARENEAVPQPIKDFKKQNGGYLFIKSLTDDRYAYVSQIEHVGMYGGGPNGYEASMNVTPPIPTTLLHELGGLYVHPDGDSAMNVPVAALRAARTPAERFAAFQTFVEVWRGPIEECHALSDADIAKSAFPIPTILDKLYRWAGACDDVMNAGYLSIRQPDKLSVDNHEYVAVCVECQWCGNYYVRKDAVRDEDPEIFADECGETRNGLGYHGTGIGLSKFLWAYYIAFNVYAGPISYQVQINVDEFQRFKDILDPLPVLAGGSQSCRAIQAYRPEIENEDDALIFAKDGVMGLVTREKDASILYLRSKTQSAVDGLLALLNVDPSRLRESM